jgi:transposase-like protein
MLAGKRRKFGKEFKLAAVESCRGNRPLVSVAEEFGVSVSMLSRWRALEVKRSKSVVNSVHDMGLSAIITCQQNTEHATGNIELLTAIIRHIRGNKSQRYAIIDELRDRYCVRQLCKILGVSRSGYYTWLSQRPNNSSEVSRAHDHEC